MDAPATQKRRLRVARAWTATARPARCSGPSDGHASTHGAFAKSARVGGRRAAVTDRARRDRILPYLLRIRRELRVPLIYVTHDATELGQIADRVLMIQDGVVLGAGDPADVLAGCEVHDPPLQRSAGRVWTASGTRRAPRTHPPPNNKNSSRWLALSQVRNSASKGLRV
jgi:hypothetical protein